MCLCLESNVHVAMMISLQVARGCDVVSNKTNTVETGVKVHVQQGCYQ